MPRRRRGGPCREHAGAALQRDARCEAIARAQTSEEIPLLEQNFPDAVSSAFSNQRSLMESSATAVGDWLSHHSLPRDVLLPLLEAHGAERTEDLAYLEPGEIDGICTDSQLGVAERSRLRQVLRQLRIVHGTEEGEAADLSVTRTRSRAPTVERLTTAQLEQHLATLRRYASSTVGPAGTVAGVVLSLHMAWAGCVADPTLRTHVLPVLFAIAKRPNAGAVEHEAALALVFLAFSLSGTVIKTELPETSAPCKHVVIIMGWLGSANEEFETVSKHYRKICPDCKVLTTVGGSDRWADIGAPVQDPQYKEHPTQQHLFSDGCVDAPWPASALCEEQLWRLAEAMLPPVSADGRSRGDGSAPRVLFHCFSNGFTLYVRLLRHLHQRGLAGEVECADALARISGVVFDSTPAWGPPPAVIPPPAIVKLVATQAVAAVRHEVASYQHPTRWSVSVLILLRWLLSLSARC